jgi:cytochrome c-type biogenesis protein CcmH
MLKQAKRALQALGLAGALALGASAHAGQAQPLAQDPVMEARLQAIARELRCLVCQNDSIAASNAPLAVDLRQQIRVKLAQGESDAQIVDFLVARYGDFVRYRPPLKASTVLLWVGPFVLLLGAVFALLRHIRRRAPGAEAALSEAESRRARELLQGKG